MKTFFHSVRRGATRALLVSSIGVGGTAVTVDAAGLGPSRQAAARALVKNFAAIPLATDVLRPAEQSFLSKAVESSRQQMRLAEVGAGNADSSEVRSHALLLVTDYRQLADALDSLIRRKGGISGAPVGGPSENYQKLTEKSGAEFDREFVRITGELTDQVMTLFEQAAADARDADVRELAGAQLPLLRNHRNRITELKKALE